MPDSSNTIIVATAGHIDHGKTALVKALTGIDADRLPEEQARGITLDLGFAYRRREGVSLGFVDVPGHERLVRTMVAGATGVDRALLVIAADDGVMPQTREHLAILDLLGLGPGVVAITKSDRVDAERLAAVSEAARALIAGTGLAGSPVLACSARDGTGIAAIAERLARPVDRGAAEDEAGFRLAVDRGFTLPGIGLVVTGAIHAGRVRVGDRLVLSPGGRTMHGREVHAYEARVRGIRAQNEAAETAGRGERCALNLTGPRLSRDTVHRGDWVLAPHLHAPTTRIDIRLRLLDAETHDPKHRTPVHVHLGAASVTGRVLLIDADTLRPGTQARASLALDAPLGALWGDRLILRDASARRTLGGGRVLDPFAPKRGARTPARRAMLDALERRDPVAAYAQAAIAAAAGLDLDRLRLARNLGSAAEASLLAEAGVVAVAGPAGRLGYPAARLSEWRGRVLDRIDALHAQEPDNPGLSVDELGPLLPSGCAPVLRPVLDALVAEGRLARRGPLYHRSGHVARLSPVDTETWEAVRAAQVAVGLDQRRLSQLADALRLEPDALRPLLDKFGRLGWLRRVSKTYYVLPDALAELARIAETVAASHPERLLTVGQFREASGIGRNITMPLLEHFDAVGFTVRLHEGRRIRGERRTLFAQDAPAEGEATVARVASA